MINDNLTNDIYYRRIATQCRFNKTFGTISVSFLMCINKVIGISLLKQIFLVSSDKSIKTLLSNNTSFTSINYLNASRF